MSSPARTVTCSSCSAAVPAESRFCLSCGQAIDSLSQAPTVAPPIKSVPISSGTVPVGGFTPGTILADRYRIVGLVGRGGMGEVYRADDLKLAQPVALKFLPKALASDPVRRERFFAEVRITRQLSHPNICRVYDIAEFEGQHFLSMEFIDGEDLASLIRRIGHLTNEKTLDIARQLAAGLAAAHEKGVLHRDLKPANVMIDGHGRARLTDFGIAIAMDDETQAFEISGTPAYMAPEQLAGKGATVRSDIYSLGLILYEMCSGKRAFPAETLAQLREQKEGTTPRSLSDLRSSVDPILERLVTRCIDRDPRGRPASVAQIAAALPGGDPLAAAIAAGETPSPEMVAAAGLKEGLRPAVGVAVLAFVIIGVLALAGISQALQRLPAGQSPEILTERVRDLVRKLGYAGRGVDREYGYMPTFTVQSLTARLGQARALDLWNKAESERLRFWYRESPESIVHRADSSAVEFSNPNLLLTGEVRVLLNPEGQLRDFEALPPAVDASSPSSASPDWSALFSEAGLDPSRFSSSKTPWKPFFYADTYAAWEGSLPEAPEIPIRIEAAAYAGTPVYFSVMGPWSLAPGAPEPPVTQRVKIATGIFLGLVVAVALGTLFFVRQNARLGRGDRRGAATLAFLSLGLSTAGWLLTEHHVAAAAERNLFLSFVGSAFLRAGVLWLLYMALEPVIRRRWPESLIPWTRLLSGEWRDPLVGRDILVGCAAGVVFSSLNRLRVLIPQSLGERALEGFNVVPPGSGKTSFLLASFITIDQGIALSLAILVAFFLLKKLLRKSWIALGVLGVLFVAGTLAAGAPWVLAFEVPLIILWFAVLSARFGLLALVVGNYINIRLNQAPLTFDTSAWYFPLGLVTALVVVGLSFAAFRISLGGTRLLKDTDD